MRKFEKDIGSRKIGFRFNMLAIGKACKLENCTVDELYKRLGLTVKDGKQEQPTDLETMVNYFFAAAMSWAEGERLKIDFTASDVSEWIQEHCDANELLLIAFEIPDIKNQTAPQTEGQLVSDN